MSELSDPLFMNRLKDKLSKTRRHKVHCIDESNDIDLVYVYLLVLYLHNQKWRTGHVKRLQSVRDERQRRRETLHKLIDEWRTEWIAKELASKRVCSF